MNEILSVATVRELGNFVVEWFTLKKKRATFWRADLFDIWEYANGDDGWHTADEIIERLESLYTLLYAVPYGPLRIPEGFWKSELGRMCAAAEIKARPDELLTVTEAARRLGVTGAYLSQAILRGKVRTVTIHDPQHPRAWRRMVDMATVKLPPKR